MDAPCRHFFRLFGDDITCLYCGRYFEENKNKYVRREQAKKHHNWHSFSGTYQGGYSKRIKPKAMQK